LRLHSATVRFMRRPSLKKKALLALGALAYDALKNPEVQKALRKVANTGVEKAGELIATAQAWWTKRGADHTSNDTAATPPAKARRRRTKAEKKTKTGRKKKKVARPKAKKLAGVRRNAASD